jgi:hypothetical protein
MLTQLKNNLILILVIIVALFLGWNYFKTKSENKQLQEQLIDQQKELIKLDTLKKISDGNYSKLVDFFKTEKELMSDLKSSNIDLYNRVKAGNEKILALNEYFISFKTKFDSGFANLKDSNTYELNVFYPERSNWFINWNGLLSRTDGKYNGSWNFGQLKFGVTLTEQPNGLYKSNISGPDFLLLDSVKVVSLPPIKVPQTRNVEFLLGGGYRINLTDSTNKAFVVTSGLQWKNSNILMIDVATDQSITGKFIYKFRSFKKN